MKNTIQIALVTLMTSVACGVNQVKVQGAEIETHTSVVGLNWQAFRAQVVVEQSTGFFIVDGDTMFENEKQLEEFYELNVRSGQLIVNRVGQADDKWSDVQKLNLTYCISNNFGANKAAVVAAMASATSAWVSAANIKYVYASAQDANCTASNSGVVFDVNPVNAGGQYLARAFFPANSRAGRNVLIDGSSFEAGQNLVGILRHELGHTLGFRHEHTRPEAGTCFEDNNWRVLTSYDAASVMHYPQCNGTGSFSSLALTALDKQGAVAIYGAPGAGGTVTPPAGTVTENFTATIAQNATKTFGPFSAKAGSTFKVSMSGSGDGDLYVRFGAAPTASSYNCRPYLEASVEECLLTVPATATQVFVSVIGYEASTVNLALNYAKETSVGPVTSAGTVKSATFSGSVAKGQQAVLAAITVVPGTSFKVVMTGAGDPDLYVKFGAAASLTVFDCRPYVNGANETCTVTVPAGATSANIMVNGFSAASYSLAVNYTAP